jgi:Zn-dependent protease
VTERETEPRQRYEPIDWQRLYAEPGRDPADDYERDYRPIQPEGPLRTLLRRLWAPIAALGFLIWKFKFAFAAIFKFKLFTTAGSALVSIGAYALWGGWWFAVALVLLLFVHEMGHVLEARRQGLPISAPVFVPFLGAAILLKQNPVNAWREAQIALAGPILGSLGAAAVWGASVVYDSEFLRAMAYLGFFLNLFNLIPVHPLDGGRAAAAIHPALWLVGFPMLVGLFFLSPNPILILIILLVGWQVWQRWKERKRPGASQYYAVAPRQRLAVSVAYLGLLVLLGLAMGATYVDRDI